MSQAALTLLVLKTAQPDRVCAFYRALGIELTEEQHGSGPLHHAGRAGDVLLEVYPLPEDAAAATTTRLGFAVPNLGATLEALQATGAAPSSSPRQTPWGLRAVVRDPDGRAVELYQREPAERACCDH